MDNDVFPTQVDMGPSALFRYHVLGMSWFVVVNRRPRGGAYVGARAWRVGPYWGWLSVALVHLLALPLATAGLSWAMPEVVYGRFQIRLHNHLSPLERTWTDWLIAGLNLLAALCAGVGFITTGDYARLAGAVFHGAFVLVCLYGLPVIRMWRNPRA